MSGPQPHTTPQAPDGTAVPHQAAATSASNLSRPTTGAPAHTTDTAPNPITAPQTSNPTGEPRSFNDELNAGDRYWKFKFALMAILIITGSIGIGCFGWIMSNIPGGGYSFYSDDSYWTLWPSIITWPISIVWCAICMLVFLARKRSVHPGVRVSIDLLLWLGFIVSALLAIVGYRDLMEQSSYGGADEYGPQQGSSDVTYPSNCNSTSSSSLDLGYGFANCTEQDAYVNKLLHDMLHQLNVELTGIVCQFFGLVLHFALFVWACIDTHRYNRTKVSTDAEKLAAEIVQTMITNGAVVPPPGRGMYYQLPPQQGYSMQPVYAQQWPGQQQYMAPGQQMQQMAPGQYAGNQGMAAPEMGAAGPSNEKGQGPRYA
ncbi:hypothetical protein EJ02DRAFT_458696 [Clathrospora elynae]|uniref:Uncharacterized protein n=1 Tax=Clathrospora elynae TaxID=706981 RepID=A0A6A5SD04_9PLEO|nr:hypothetical protein EJ02DRAFT_458696 [Clathrospora elynae]